MRPHSRFSYISDGINWNFISGMYMGNNYSGTNAIKTKNLNRLE